MQKPGELKKPMETGKLRKTNLSFNGHEVGCECKKCLSAIKERVRQIEGKVRPRKIRAFAEGLKEL
jgi:hypothetical protein